MIALSLIVFNVILTLRVKEKIVINSREEISQVEYQKLNQRYNILIPNGDNEFDVSNFKCSISKIRIKLKLTLLLSMFIILKIDFMNENKLQQDHPCVVDIIRQLYLHPPAPVGKATRLSNADEIEPSTGQVPIILSHLNFKAI